MSRRPIRQLLADMVERIDWEIVHLELPELTAQLRTLLSEQVDEEEG